MAAILLRNGSRFNVTPHPLSNPKRVSKLLPNIMRPQLNERVQVQFDRTSLSPATIVSLDSRHDNSEDGSYLVRLALTDQIVRVTSDQVQRLQITLMKKPPMTSSTNLPKLVGPTRHQLEWYQLEIKQNQGALLLQRHRACASLAQMGWGERGAQAACRAHQCKEAGPC